MASESATGLSGRSPAASPPGLGSRQPAAAAEAWLACCAPGLQRIGRIQARSRGKRGGAAAAACAARQAPRGQPSLTMPPTCRHKGKETLFARVVKDNRGPLRQEARACARQLRHSSLTGRQVPLARAQAGMHGARGPGMRVRIVVVATQGPSSHATDPKPSRRALSGSKTSDSARPSRTWAHRLRTTGTRARRRNGVNKGGCAGCRGGAWRAQQFRLSRAAPLRTRLPRDRPKCPARHTATACCTAMAASPLCGAPVSEALGHVRSSGTHCPAFRAALCSSACPSARRLVY